MSVFRASIILIRFIRWNVVGTECLEENVQEVNSCTGLILSHPLGD